MTPLQLMAIDLITEKIIKLSLGLSKVKGMTDEEVKKKLEELEIRRGVAVGEVASRVK